MKNKITLKEFFESKERLAIHCDTEEKANKLLIEFDKLGKTWWAGESYLQYNNFNEHKDRTCYSNEGVEIGEEFIIKGWSSYPYKFDGVLLRPDNIEKLPNKPQLTDAERVILENLPKEYEWIARDMDDELFVFSTKPNKEGMVWGDRDAEFIGISPFEHLFQFIKWEDEESYNIEELLKGE